MIGLFVAAVGSLGHHLPGLIRAYGDRDLFRRFRARFILAPLFLTAAYVPFSRHPDVLRLVILIWGCWHALMQVYGFVRIYDVKVGSVAAATAYWDWMMCLCWFTCAQIFSNVKMSELLSILYRAHVPLIPPVAFHAFRWICLSISIAVLIGFLVNYVRQYRSGPKPNPVKLLMLASGIGCWWFAMVYIENIVLGIALFEICHDVQYLAIVWLYNCRRVNAKPSADLAGFMRFLFRGGSGLVAVYVGLVLAYGLFGIIPHLSQNQNLKSAFAGVVWISSVLHYYYDGFIWKVREKATQSGLGLATATTVTRMSSFAWSGLTHALKWSPIAAVAVWLFASDLVQSSTSNGQTSPQSNAASAEAIQRTVNIALAMPENAALQINAAIGLSFLGEEQKALESLERVLEREPRRSTAHAVKGQILRLKGNLDEAESSYQTALDCARKKDERTMANLGLGDVYLAKKQFDLARKRYLAALQDDPKLEPARRALLMLQSMPSSKS